MNDPAIVRRAECVCGALRADCTGAPQKVSACHCDACRRRTGSAFGLAAFYTRTSVVTEGKRTAFVLRHDDGTHVRFSFCPTCGTTLFWEPSWKPDALGIAAGAFADEALAAPGQSVWDSRRYPWLDFAEPILRRACG